MIDVTPRPVALVTGGAQRIGAAIAEDLAAHGWQVAVHFNTSSDEADALVDRIAARGGSAVAISSDLTEPDEVEELLPAAARELGTVTLLVNNAAMFVRDAMGALDRDIWDAQLGANLAAPVFLSQALAAALPDGQEGNIVNVLDQRVLKPMPVYFSYQIAKSALFTATRTMAQALAPRVRVHGIAPGPTLRHGAQPDAHFASEIASVPLQRGAELAEFGRAVRFFVENRSITGQTIALDGGQHLAWLTADHAHID